MYSKVEYTFGYKRCGDGKLRIFLHHSSVPYAAAAAAPAAGALTEEDVLESQAAWASAIKSVPKTQKYYWRNCSTFRRGSSTSMK